MIKRTCRLSGKEFIIEREDLEFYAKMGVITEEQLKNWLNFCHSALDAESSTEKNGSPIGVGEDKVVYEDKIPRDLLIGLPTLCPEERQRRRLAWRNERKLYQRKCDCCEKVIISIYDDKAEFPVYCQDCWWSDKWDAKDYGQDFDFSRDFFPQFKDLIKKVPRLSLLSKGSEKSQYTNHCDHCKNSYMTICTAFSEDILFSKWVIKCRDCIDCYKIEECELCYQVQYSKKTYNCSYCFAADNCVDCMFVRDCKNCKNCFGCINLRHKQYYWFNKKLTKEEYFNKLEKFKSGDNNFVKEAKSFFSEFIIKNPRKSNTIINCENSPKGDFLYNCKNVNLSFDVIESEDAKYCYDMGHIKDAYDAYESAFNCQLHYETHACNRTVDLMFCNICYDSNDIILNDNSHNSSDLFGCTGIRNAQYCILNKQYTKEEYFKLREKIVEHMKKTGEWGEFFPAKLSPFAYNETVAQEYFPLTQEEAQKQGYKWKEEVINKNYEKLRENFSWANIPDDIDQVEDDICGQILFCERSGKPYKIQKAELRFYRKINLPIPRLHPDERHKDRMALRNPRTLFARKCADCGCEIQTTFAPERPEKVLCEKCYLEAVI